MSHVICHVSMSHVTYKSRMHKSCHISMRLSLMNESCHVHVIYRWVMSPVTSHMTYPGETHNTAIHGNTLQHTGRTAKQYNALQCNATHGSTLQHTTTHCSALQRTATRCNTLQHTATHWKIRGWDATFECHISQVNESHMNESCHTWITPGRHAPLQHTALHCNTRCTTLHHTSPRRTTGVETRARDEMSQGE